MRVGEKHGHIRISNISKGDGHLDSPFYACRGRRWPSGQSFLRVPGVQRGDAHATQHNTTHPHLHPTHTHTAHTTERKAQQPSALTLVVDWVVGRRVEALSFHGTCAKEGRGGEESECVKTNLRVTQYQDELARTCGAEK
jgi:hypothetical protein